ncbi:LOW QUALITY PROTEIN: sterile alpha motif domain-containing protein 1-like [Agelaius phoeniceus]|uniref:LOW QUALITY PROTEIN: sterile alpha motif domain-containing protein 1-like n=1 Tax=Agelaius phoeniceus TaxID=39638 RepID=UPI0040552FD2
MAVPPPPPPGPEQAPRYQEWILDTIDSLRSRKARPDLERICRMVRRRHGPEPERTRAELEKLIQQRAVLRVSYKGSISYRNAARVQPPRRPPPPARRPPPVSLRDTARLLGGDGRLTRGRLRARPRPAAAGGRPERPPGRAAAAERAAGPGPSAPGWAPSPRPAGSAGERPREGAEQQRGSAREEEEEEEDEDEEDEDGTGSEASEDAGPPRQLNGEGRGGPPLRPPGQPPPERPPQPKALSPALAGAEPSVPLSPGRPGPQAAEGAPFSCTAGRKDKAVDPVEWSVRDVVEYFTEAGFPEQAGAFQEQEIDGKSLLLMQRADVLTGLSIRLGPALKIYEYHVKLLQRSHFQDEEPPPEPFPA